MKEILEFARQMLQTRRLRIIPIGISPTNSLRRLQNTYGKGAPVTVTGGLWPRLETSVSCCADMVETTRRVHFARFWQNRLEPAHFLQGPAGPRT